MRLNKILENGTIEILVDVALLAEIHEVINRPKFSKYLNKSQINSFLELINERCTFIYTTSKVTVSPDPKDDFLLALCQDGLAEYLITGNKLDLLALKHFGDTRILSLTEFLEMNSESTERLT
jgi:putative PIN family toxin of toxin-antitoxin system